MIVPPALCAALTARAPDGMPARDRERNPVAERMVSLVRALRPARVEVEGAVVLLDAAGRAFAVAYDGRILVRAESVPAALTAEGVDDLPGWWSVDPHPDDVTFARGTDVLRHTLQSAFGDRK